MMSHVIDGVLLLALLLTSLRVGAMYRELKRLRGYQSQYVEVFGETSRAADHIGEAVRHSANEGRDVLERLEALMEEARELSAPARSRGASVERGRACGRAPSLKISAPTRARVCGCRRRRRRPGRLQE